MMEYFGRTAKNGFFMLYGMMLITYLYNIDISISRVDYIIILFGSLLFFYEFYLEMKYIYKNFKENKK